MLNAIRNQLIRFRQNRQYREAAQRGREMQLAQLKLERTRRAHREARALVKQGGRVTYLRPEHTHDGRHMAIILAPGATKAATGSGTSSGEALANALETVWAKA